MNYHAVAVTGGSSKTPLTNGLDIMGLWDGLANAQVFERGVYLGPGSYDIEIVRCIAKSSQKSGMGFLVEMLVLSSTNPAHPSDSKRTWWQGLKSPVIAMPAIKGFLIPALGFTIGADDPVIAAEFTPRCERFQDRVVSPENPLSGYCVHVEASMIKTKEQKDFTAHNWSPFDYAAAGFDKPDALGLLRSMPPAYGVPSYPNTPPPMPNTAAQLSPDGRFQLVNNQWVPYTAPPPPPAYAPPPPPPGPVIQYSPDGRYQLDTRSNSWVPRA